ncbi:MAG TPA: hypothetical protein VKH19_17535 [Gemmatimonadaceae bacterium]|nr:hypothetical protein [Gemmatimonadaceae bacterium]
MSKYTGRFSMAVAASVLLVACGGDRNKSDTALAADTSLNRDLALAGRDTAAQPQLTDVPAGGAATPGASGTKSPTSTRTSTKSTSTRTSTPTKTASGNTVTKGTGTRTSTGVIASGTTLSLASNSQICTNTNKVGDKFTATLNESVSGSNGAVIPAGSKVTLTVTALKRSENVNDKIVMEFSVDAVEVNGKSYALAGNVTSAAVDRVRNQPKSADAKKVIGGAAIGAIAGQVLGKNTKSTVIGAAAGAAAGAATAAATANYEGCVRSGGNIVVTLTSPVTVTV